jgi:hypothetical protein
MAAVILSCQLLARTALFSLGSAIALVSSLVAQPAHAVPSDEIEFFEKKIRPVLIEHCYPCHSAVAAEIQGGLRLDVQSGWQTGGDSGEPAVRPGQAEDSPLIQALRHAPGVSPMPPQRPQLPHSVIADFSTWVNLGAPDPRDVADPLAEQANDWNTKYLQRLDWWSLQPLDLVPPPARDQAESPTLDWSRTAVDRFILSGLQSHQLQPAPEAQRRTLIRRLSFALTGLPPEPELVERFAGSDSLLTYEQVVDHFLASPHFGEHWGRHWMDVVHYADTHGYEWDVPAKNAWQYRDYLVRAFNSDLSYQRLLLEHLAGDLVEPRLDPDTGRNESLIGPMALRLGERRHGDSAAAEGVSQEAVANMIDTIGKAFLATTLACAQCHDHKLDAIEQRDYYALAGSLMSSRFSPRTINMSVDNQAVLEELRLIKRDLRKALVKIWLAAIRGEPTSVLAARLASLPGEPQSSSNFPTTLIDFWQRSLTEPVTAAEFFAEREQRLQWNAENLRLWADFAPGGDSTGWGWDGLGMKYGQVDHGEMVVSHDGDSIVQHILPAGRYTHVWSPRLAGLVQSPLLAPESKLVFSAQIIAGKVAAQTFVIDGALNSERLKFINHPTSQWLTLTAGNFDTLEGGIDSAQRRVYWELATKALNNYFPPRVGYGGMQEPEIHDPRSWLGVSRIYTSTSGSAPQDELGRFVPMFSSEDDSRDWNERIAATLNAAILRWADGACTEQDVGLLNDALQTKLLPNELSTHSELANLVQRYRQVEQRLQADVTVGSVADWCEGRDERLAIRGVYTDLGEPVQRGSVRFLGSRFQRADPHASGRLELALTIADDSNPLTARVYVNRVWHYLFGSGLVRTVDDFGHLGERPVHPQLLDYLAARFMREGWSTKRLVRLLVISAAWRQSSVPTARAVELDPDNRLWHHVPLRRLEAEAIRDSLLSVAGQLDRAMGGPPIEPYRVAEDAQKRLFRGPVDAQGRRSLYIEQTLMEPPRFLALFNQPLPKVTVGSRDVTNVPDQSLALLNDPLVVSMARDWSRLSLQDNAQTPAERLVSMFSAALGRPPAPPEMQRLLDLTSQLAQEHAVSDRDQDLLHFQAVWQDVAHSLINLKEFIYVP